jgi:N-ethylmaleimide reductase
MHVGRIAHSANRYVSEPPVAPSVVRAAGQMWTDALGLQDLDTPRALDTSEIPGVRAQYAQATTNALAAGFDGVELHSASGYLPMQFLSTGSNRRKDGYGGGVHNRNTVRRRGAGSDGSCGRRCQPRRDQHQPGDAVQRHSRR